MAIDVGNIVTSASKALAPIGATLSDTWSAVVGDRVASWRLVNAAALQVAVDTQIRAMGLKIDRSKIPERYALNWFEEATKQDEPELQDLFAKLLVGAAAGDVDASDRRHLEILTRFTPADATAFQWFFGSASAGGNPSDSEYDVWRKIKVELGSGAWMSIEHLMTLGVVERRFDTVKKETDRFGEEWTANAEITATERGASLFRACNPTMTNISEASSS